MSAVEAPFVERFFQDGAVSCDEGEVLFAKGESSCRLFCLTLALPGLRVGRSVEKGRSGRERLRASRLLGGEACGPLLFQGSS